MKEKFSFKSLLPHVLVIIVFIAVTFTYFSPLVGGKKQLQQGDVTNFDGMSKEIVDYREKYHEEPLWTNSMFGGMPAYQISVHFKGNLIQYVDKILTLGLPHPAGMVFLYMLGFYILLLVLRVNPWLGLMGAIAFAFSSYFFIILEAGHNSKAHAIGLMSPVLAGIILTFRGRLLAGGALTALAFALELTANHIQITYYMSLVILVFCIVELVYAFKNKTLLNYAKALAVVGIATVLAVSTNAGNLLSTYEYGKYTTRGKSELTFDKENQTSGLDRDYATDWSYGKEETMSLMIPNFKGGSSGSLGNNKDAMKGIDPQLRPNLGQIDQYWGDQPFTSGPVYAGAIVMFLCVLGLFILEGPLKWTLLISAILSIVLAWGRNFPALTNFFLDHFPGYNKFRAVSMTLVIAEFCLPLIAVLGLNKLTENPSLFNEKIKILFSDKLIERKKLFIMAFVLTGGLCLLFYLAPGVFTSFEKTGEFEKTFRTIKQGNPGVSDQQVNSVLTQLLDEAGKARQNILKTDALRSFIMILLAAGTLWFYFKNNFDKRLLYATMIVYILADMWMIDKRYLNNENFVPKTTASANPFISQGRPNAADQQILQDTDPDFRVLDVAVNTFNDASTSYFHKSIGGYHGAKLKRYQELIEHQISHNNTGVLNMLNTKYIITQGQGGEPLAQSNRNAMGNAWFVHEIKWVVNADSEITALTGFNPARTAIIDQRFKPELEGLQLQPDSSATIKLTSYKANELKYDSKAATEQLAVFSEIYYKDGWNAYVDGKLTPHVRANYVLRAMRVPAGEHKIEFRFEPTVYATGERISGISSALLLIFVVAIIFIEIKKIKTEPA